MRSGRREMAPRFSSEFQMLRFHNESSLALLFPPSPRPSLFSVCFRAFASSDRNVLGPSETYCLKLVFALQDWVSFRFLLPLETAFPLLVLWFFVVVHWSCHSRFVFSLLEQKKERSGLGALIVRLGAFFHLNEISIFTEGRTIRFQKTKDERILPLLSFHGSQGCN